MDRNRLVAVRAGGQRASGYVIAPRLVLTSAHVVGRRGEPAQVYHPGGEPRYAGLVVWRGTPGGRDDAALVLIEDEQWHPPQGAAVRWGRLVTVRPGQDAETWGVPEVAQRTGGVVGNGGPNEGPAQVPRKEFRQLQGTVNPGSGIVRRRHLFDLLRHAPERTAIGVLPWSGLSGAPMFCGGLLTGVVFSELPESAHASLEVVPAQVLLSMEDFRAALTEYGAEVSVEPVEFQNLLERVESDVDDALSSPAALLRARRRIVGFHGRDDLMAQLVDWCSRSGPGVWLLHGPGGQGKTRVAHQLSDELTGGGQSAVGDGGWTVVWPREAVTPSELEVLRDAAGPVLVVLDYAETRAAQLSALLAAAVGHTGGTPFKLLLLARAAGEWWSGARVAPGADEAVRALLEGARVVGLPALETDRDARPGAYRAAVRAFAAALPGVRGQQQHDWSALADGLEVPRLSGAGLGNALTLHMTALADLLDLAVRTSGDRLDSPATGARTAEGTRPMDAEDRLLEHELAYWHRASAVDGLFPGLSRETLTDAMAAATVFGTDERASGDALLRRVPALADQSYDRRRRVRRWVEALYPAAGGRPWGTLQPDRLAERFVGDHLRSAPELARALLGGPESLPDLSPAQVARFLTLLTRAAAHPPLRGRLDGLVAELCVEFLPVLGGAAIEVATQVEEPEPLLRALRAVTTDPTTPHAQLAALADQLPATSYNLAPWAVELAERLVAEQRNEEAPMERTPADRFLPRRSADRMAEDPRGTTGQRHPGAVSRAARSRRLQRLTERAAGTGRSGGLADHRTALATRLRQLAVRLMDMGRNEEALKEIREAIATVRPSAGAGAGEARTELGACLNDLAACLTALGDWPAALDPAAEAVELLREATRSGAPEDRRRTWANLASSLNTLSNLQSELGRAADALATMEEAVGLRRELVREYGERFRPWLVSELNNLAVRHRDLGRREEALAASTEAVKTCERLVETDPDAHLEIFARVLSTLSNCLGDMGRPEPALAAVERSVAVRRRLAQARPEVFEGDLALSLNSLAVDLGEFGRYAEAGCAVRESVKIYRKLAEAQPTAFRHLLAMSLNTLANHCADVGEHEQALVAAREAFDLYVGLAKGLPETYAQDVAMSRCTLAGRLGDLGRHEEAVEEIGRATDDYRELVRTGTTAVQPELARCLNNLGSHLRSLGRSEEALTAVTEAAQVVEGLLVDNPEAFNEMYVQVVGHQARCLKELGRLAEAVEVMRSSVETGRRLTEVSFARYADDFAGRLRAYAALLYLAEEYEEAVKWAREAVKVWQRVGDADPADAKKAASALDFVGHLLSPQGRFAEAVAARQEAVKAWRRLLVRADASEGRLALALSLIALGRELLQLGRRGEVLTALDEAAGLGQGLSAADRAVHEVEFLSVATAYGVLLFAAGRGEEARAAARTSVRVYERLAQADPARIPSLAMAHIDHSTVLVELGDRDAALCELERAVEVVTPLAEGGVAAASGILGRALAELGEQLASEPPRRTEAVAATAKALALIVPLAEADPAAYGTDLARAMANHGLRLAEIGQYDEATALTEQAVARCRGLVEVQPAAHAPDLAVALHAYGRARLLAGVRRPQALDAVEEALALTQEIGGTEPALVERMVRVCLETRDGLLEAVAAE